MTEEEFRTGNANNPKDLMSVPVCQEIIKDMENILNYGFVENDSMTIPNAIIKLTQLVEKLAITGY